MSKPEGNSDFLAPTVFMNNINGTKWIYNGTPVSQSLTIKKSKFPWVLYAKKIRNKTYF